MTWCLAVVAAGLAGGCANGSEYDAEDMLFGALPRLPPSACVQPVETFCGSGSRCLSYDEQVRQMEASVTTYCRPGLYSLRIGTCGDLRYTSSGHPFGGEIRYYDASGAVVAASWGDDVVATSGCDDGYYGFIPHCRHEETRGLCPPPPR